MNNVMSFGEWNALMGQCIECLKLNVGHGCQSIISCYSVVPQDGEGGLQGALAQRLRAAFKLLRIARDQKQ